jgi:uncharacterized protein YlxP (DUF503 family)
MMIGTCLIDLRVPGCRSLKDKRQIIKALKDSIRRKFNVSVAELDHQDTWQRSLMGIAVVSRDARFANQVISKVVNEIEGNVNVEVIDYRYENR